jgi:hypothetical protein
MRHFIELVESSGYFVLHLPQGTLAGYQARLENGAVKAIVHTEDRRCFWTVDIPVSVIEAGDADEVRRWIERRMPVAEER